MEFVVFTGCVASGLIVVVAAYGLVTGTISDKRRLAFENYDRQCLAARATGQEPPLHPSRGSLRRRIFYHQHKNLYWRDLPDPATIQSTKDVPDEVTMYDGKSYRLDTGYKLFVVNAAKEIQEAEQGRPHDEVSWINRQIDQRLDQRLNRLNDDTYIPLQPPGYPS